jgi:D-alanyl-lipoteichoic acid acyltransferase DltB (MBOAT superfamily)
MGVVADRMFGLGSEQLTMNAAWLGALAYSFQIFFDFSGYSDMAIGLGRMLGFRFPEFFSTLQVTKRYRVLATMAYVALVSRLCLTYRWAEIARVGSALT